MKRHGCYEPPAFKLDDTVVVHDEVADRLHHKHRFRPYFSLIGRELDVGLAVVKIVLHEVEERDFPASEAQERNAHDITSPAVLNEDFRLAP